MRLEVHGETNVKASWIPSMLSINLDDEDCTQINYDIQGEVSFTPNEFDAYCKGDLLIEEGDDYVDMDDKQIKQLVKLLKNPKNEIIITVYPNEDDIEEEAIFKNCVAHLELWTSKEKCIEVSFNFTAEYVE